MVESGQPCTAEPIGPAALSAGDITLGEVNSREYLHLIKAIPGERFQIGWIYALPRDQGARSDPAARLGFLRSRLSAFDGTIVKARK